MALLRFTREVREKMLWDSAASRRGHVQGLFMFRVRAAVYAHDWDLPLLHDVPALVAVQLQDSRVFHGKTSKQTEGT